MARELIGFTLILLVFAIAFRIWRSVRARRARQEGELPELAASQGGLEIGPALYVATVYATRPLERLWAFGLGSRGKARVFVNDSSISIERQGERDFAIPLSSISRLTRERATIDKGVEKDGLVAIHWTLGETKLMTHLRIIAEPRKFRKQLESAIGVRFE